MSMAATTARGSIRRHLVGGMVAIMVLVGGIGGWAATTELSGAVIASGSLVVDSNVKKVQHPTGGIVGDLRVRDGDRVKAGKILMRLDETVTRANLAIVVKSLDELSTRQARLEAERDGVPDIEFPVRLVGRSADPDIRGVISGEQKLFEFRKTARNGQKEQLRQRISQLQEEIQGLTGQANAKMREIALINRELEGVRDLWAKNLVPISRVTLLEREAVRLDGERNQLIASAAQAKGKITETELQIIQIDQELRSEVAKELREIQGKDRRAGRTARGCRRSAQARRYSGPARWHCPSTGRPYCGGRDQRRRSAHVARARVGRVDGRSARAPAGYRPTPHRSVRGYPVRRLQSANNAGDQWCPCHASPRTPRRIPRVGSRSTWCASFFRCKRSPG